MRRPENLLKALESSVSSPRRIVATSISSIILFILMVLGARPAYTLQLLGNSLAFLPVAVRDLFLYNSSTAVRAMTVLYAVLGGVTLTVTAVKLREGGLGLGSIGVAPGFLASGCAGCGVGLLGIIGLSGGLALLPFHGKEILAAGILFLLIYLERTGDPEVCEISYGS